MDSNSTPQTVAQAVAAAAQQQQQQQQQQAQQAQQPQAQAAAAVQPQHIHAATVDNLTCQWLSCGERCDNPEALYDHVCERHVGRKSTNNLNLTCQWGACRTTTVKRDHITSHIRVHVPLKPHKCEFCGKAFKRPQDLKKHVKTHADDSVLMNSPQHGDSSRVGNITNSYYNAGHDMSGNPYGNYQPAMGGAGIAAGGYSQPPNSQYAGYGSVSYPNNTAMADIQSMDTRRRAIEALNDFLGDIKRRAIDPSSYYDVGNRLQTNALPLPIGGTGYNTGYNNSNYSGLNAATLLENFNNGTHLNHQPSHVPNVATQNYSLPVSNARTKNDLQDIDRFLEQLQATVYETSNAAAAAGIQQPGLHSHAFNEFLASTGGHHSQYRSSNSPPAFQNHMGNSMNTSGANVPGLSAPSSASLDTPALTPASVTSYSSSSHSPMSSHSRASFGSASGSNMYPSLPSLAGMSDLGAGYPATTSAPASGLVSGFDGLDGRRYSGGRLQRQAPATAASEDTDMADATEDDGSRTPRASDEKRPSSRNGTISLDPALRFEDQAPTSPGEAGTTTPASAADERRQEQWVENIRVIETLRKWISDRLKANDFEDADADMSGSGAGASSVAQAVKKAVADRNAVETAKMATAEMAEEKMAEALKAEINYPSLPTA